MEQERRPAGADHRPQFGGEDLGGEQPEGGERGLLAEGGDESGALVKPNAKSAGDHDNQR